MMRERERIQRILNLLNTICEQQPDWRFHQLMSYFQYLNSMQNNDYRKRKIIEMTGSSNMEAKFLGMLF
jgi:hypothetical protein